MMSPAPSVYSASSAWIVAFGVEGLSPLLESLPGAVV